MSGTEETKPAVKPRRRKKGDVPRQKSNSTKSAAPVQMQTPEPQQEQAPHADQPPAVPEPLEAAVAEAMATEPDAIPADVPAPAEAAAAVSLQTIANAYRDYTRKSFEQFGSFFEQLSGVRSLDKAVEVQTEFLKRAYENSVAESQKIRDLHRKLAKQTFEPLQNLAGKTPETHGKS